MLVSPVLSDTVEVQAGSVVCEGISDVDDNSVAPISNYSRSRECPVYKQDRPFYSIWRCCRILYIEPVFPRHACFRHYIVVVGTEIVVSPA